MKRILHRAAAGALAGGLLLGGVAPGAFAQEFEDLPYAFEQERCETFQAARPGTLTDAWHLKRLGMDRVWQLATGRDVKVAVIDTGVSGLGSPYLPRERLQGLDFVGQTEAELRGEKADCLHGTLVASLIAAGRHDDGALHQDTNFAGIAPDAQILAYRALTASPPGADDAQAAPVEDSLLPVARAVDRAVEDGAHIINLSLTVQAGVAFFDEFQAAIEAALAAGVIVVAASGNGHGEAALFPASFPGVIAVGMSTPGDSADPLSYRHSPVTVGAPGVDIVALAPSQPVDDTATAANQAFHTADAGTSYAAPLVSGVLALMIHYDRQMGRPPLTPATAAQRLADTADPPPATAPDPQLGHGIVNPLRALLQARPAEPDDEATTAVEEPAPPPAPEPVDATVPALGLGVAVGSVLLVGMGVVAAIAIPAATRRPPSTG